MLLLNTLRVIFIILAFLTGLLIQKPLNADAWFPYSVMLFAVAIVGLEIIFRTQYRQRIVAVFFGLIIGFVVSIVLIWLLTQITPTDIYNQTVVHYQPLIMLLVCYISVTTIVQTKDELRLILPYVDFQNKSGQGSAVVVDTSALIDGRLVELTRFHLMPNHLILPRFVLVELQTLSDSADEIKRARGKRGMDNASLLQSSSDAVVSTDSTDFSDLADVDQKLINLAKRRGAMLVTTDGNLTKVARLQDIGVINVHEIAHIVKPPVVPGETMQLRIAKPGDQRRQGVAYLEDGTMVVIEDAVDYIGSDVMCEIEKISQTKVGRIVFARKIIEGEGGHYTTDQDPATDPKRDPSASRRSKRTSRPNATSSRGSKRDRPPSVSANEIEDERNRSALGSNEPAAENGTKRPSDSDDGADGVRA